MDKKIYLGIGCILFGICVMRVPFIKESGEDQKQQKMLTQWQQEMSQTASGEDTSGIESNTGKGTDTGKDLEEVVGILRIPAIELESPVLKGATEQNLNLSAATVEPTAAPGADGNFAVAGHNSRTYGRHFNRLAELKNGDELFVDTRTGHYAYTVTDIYVVEAEDVWVLGDTIDGGEITLITCHYPEEGKTQRLIVKGILQK